MGYELITELPDTYQLTVTDGNGCQATASMTIDACNSLNLSSFIERTADCNEEGTSTISVNLPPGTAIGPYEFRWIKAGVGLIEFDPSDDGTASLENAEPGEYCLHLRTMNGCEATVCVINIVPKPSLVINYSVTPSKGYKAVSFTEYTLHKKMGGLAAYSRVSPQLPKELDA